MFWVLLKVEKPIALRICASTLSSSSASRSIWSESGFDRDACCLESICPLGGLSSSRDRGSLACSFRLALPPRGGGDLVRDFFSRSSRVGDRDLSWSRSDFDGG